MLFLNAVLQNRYRIIRQLGQGGMGTVYEALDQRVSAIVALKETVVADNEEARRAFEREAALLANLHHQSLPKVMDYFIEGGAEYLVMEYIPGHDLAELLELRGTPFEVRQVLRWGDELLRVLEYLHGRRSPILHRDIKPSNLKLTKQGELFLLDFGLAKGSAGQMPTVLTSRSVRGYTPVYASLEQIYGKGTDTRSDLYSLGATLYHLLTNTAPVDAPTRFDALEDDEPDPLRPAHEINPRVHPAISAVIQQAMAVSRKHRPTSASEMRFALLRAQEEAQRAAEVGRHQEAEQKRYEEEQRRRVQEEEAARRKAEEVRRKREAEEAARRAEEERRRRQEEERQKREAEEAARRLAEEEAARKLAAEKEAACRLEEERRGREEEEEARRRAAAEADARKRAEEEQQRIEATSERRRQEAEGRARLEDEARRQEEAETLRLRYEQEEALPRRTEEQKRERQDAETLTLTAKPSLPDARPEAARQTPAVRPQRAQGSKPVDAALVSTLKVAQPEKGSTGAVSSSQHPTARAALLPGGKKLLVLLSAFILVVVSVTIIAFALMGRTGDGSQPTVKGPAASPQQPETGGKPTPPEGMAYVPGGTFTMGRNGEDEYERPAHLVSILTPFFIDAYEVTNEDYAKFVRETNHRPPTTWTKGAYPANDARKPVTGVTWKDANDYARWAGKRLPTEAEWEYAARGPSSTLYPWGNEWRVGLANADGAASNVVEVGTYKGASPFGAYDMVGNAWEWTASTLKAYSGGQLPEEAQGDMVVIRGGNYKSTQKEATTTYRMGLLRVDDPSGYNTTGFRCVKNID